MSQLTVRHLGFDRETRTILREIDFDHDRGRILTVLGPSGSGKTTLLWLLAGLLKPTRGEIRFAAAPSFGMVFQDGGLWEHTTVRNHLDVVLRGHGLNSKQRSQRIDRTLEQAGLSQLARRLPGQLSGGERQRLSLARALTVEPDWLLLDEPTSQLDGPAREQMIDLLARQLRATSAGIIIATHQVDLALRLSDELAILDEGIIAQRGPPAGIYEKPNTLKIACLLGPASELSPEMVLGVPDCLRSANTVIIRPEHLNFVRDESGHASVRACHFAAGGWRVDVVLRNGQHVIASSAAQLGAGAVGNLHWRDGC
ncbi:MAG TPA: ABC transporter ATP-binding protein [Tepidisphaeraceae bacterium]|jgi:ABC-type Fe3+/spermidine/putrescine transport system ATPase subunit|nr:ABC transporter ATP-binding protein [Tepidisphaeraceae bacterium]